MFTVQWGSGVHPQILNQFMNVYAFSGYYRKYVPNNATVAAPLTALLSKEAKFCYFVSLPFVKLHFKHYVPY